MVQRCREANALTAFMWFSAATFAITALLTIDEMRRNRTILNLHKARSGRVTA